MLRAISIWDEQAETTVQSAQFGPPKKLSACSKVARNFLSYSLILIGNELGTKPEKKKKKKKRWVLSQFFFGGGLGTKPPIGM